MQYDRFKTEVVEFPDGTFGVRKLDATYYSLDKYKYYSVAHLKWYSEDDIYNVDKNCKYPDVKDALKLIIRAKRVVENGTFNNESK